MWRPKHGNRVKNSSTKAWKGDTSTPIVSLVDPFWDPPVTDSWSDSQALPSWFNAILNLSSLSNIILILRFINLIFSIVIVIFIITIVIIIIISWQSWLSKPFLPSPKELGTRSRYQNSCLPVCSLSVPTGVHLCSWGSPNLPIHSIYLRSLARGVGRGEVGITGFQPNILSLLDQHSIKSYNNRFLKVTAIGLGPI